MTDANLNRHKGSLRPHEHEMSNHQKGIEKKISVSRRRRDRRTSNTRVAPNTIPVALDGTYVRLSGFGVVEMAPPPGIEIVRRSSDGLADDVYAAERDQYREGTTIDNSIFTLQNTPPCARYEGGENDDRLIKIWIYVAGHLGGGSKANELSQKVARLVAAGIVHVCAALKQYIAQSVSEADRLELASRTSPFGYDLPSRPCLSDGEFTPDTGHSDRNVRNPRYSFRSSPRSGHRWHASCTGKSDPTRTLIKFLTSMSYWRSATYKSIRIVRACVCTRASRFFPDWTSLVASEISSRVRTSGTVCWWKWPRNNYLIDLYQ